MRTLLAIAAAFAVLAAPATAAAPFVKTEVVEVRIDMGSVDLTNDADRAKLEQRIEASLVEACTTKSASRYGRQRERLDQKCLTEARKDAMMQVEEAALAAADANREVAAS